MPVAQLDRASVCGTEGRTFESYQAHHEMICPVGAIFIFCNLLGLGWLKMFWLAFLDWVEDIATD